MAGSPHYNCSMALIDPARDKWHGIDFRPFRSSYHMTQMTGMSVEEWVAGAAERKRRSKQRALKIEINYE